MESGTKYRIGTFAIILLVIFALICDLIGLIPFAKDIVGIIFWLIADVYLWKAKVGLFNGKTLAAEGVSLLTSLVPVIQELPVELTAGIVAIIFITRFEDKTGIKMLGIGAGSLNSSGTRLAQPATPLNSGGMRIPSSASQSESSLPKNRHIAPAPSRMEQHPAPSRALNLGETRRPSI